MTSYVLAQLSIHDPDRYARYARAVPATLEPYGGRVLVADDDPDVVAGGWDHHRVVLISFPTDDQAHAWAASPAYQAVAPDREAATEGVVMSLRGLDRRPPQNEPEA